MNNEEPRPGLEVLDELKGWATPSAPPVIPYWNPPDDTERRELRERAVNHAAYMHDDVNMTFERPEAVREMLKTAQEIYDWIIEPESS